MRLRRALFALGLLLYVALVVAIFAAVLLAAWQMPGTVGPQAIR